MTKRSGAESSIAWVNAANAQQSTSNNGEEWNWYHAATGRLWYTKHINNPDTTGQSQGGGGRPAVMNRYDNAGNLVWTGMAILRLEPDQVEAEAQSERRIYYGPDGKLRAVEARALYKNSPVNTGASGFSRSFEEYRYDALGRRVATRFDQGCDDLVDFNLYNAPCHLSGFRRTIWDGSQELGEIQLPTGQIENDLHVGQGSLSANKNLAPFYGAVAYAYDGRIDQPIAIKRLRYSNLTPSNTIAELAAFTYNPVWNVQGTVPYVVGSGSLPAAICSESMTGGTKATCLSWVLQGHSLAYRDVSTLWHRAWQGTLLQDKVGAGGLMYRRNRFYDSKSGRFTQEDPIGLAGGLNLYGYAGGDPINFHDPFGLEFVFKGDDARELEGAYRRGRRILSARAGNGDADAAAALGLLNQMEKSKRVFTIASGRTSTGAIGNTDDAGNVTVDVALSKEEPNTRLPFVVLHEMGHSYTKALYGPNIRSEAWALLFENTARSAIGWELRPDNHGYPKHVPKQ